MRNSYRYTLILLLLVILSVLAWLVLGSREPLYRGNPISYWIDRVGEEVPDAGYFPPVDSKAIPYLVRALQRRSGPWRGYFNNIRSHAPAFIRRRMHVKLSIEDWKVRANAAQALGTVGTNSTSAIYGLLRVLKKEEKPVIRMYAVESLQKIGKGNEAVTKSVIDALHDKAPEVRDAAADALWQLDPATAKKLLK